MFDNRGQNVNQLYGKQTTGKKDVKETHFRTMTGCSQYAKVKKNHVAKQ